MASTTRAMHKHMCIVLRLRKGGGGRFVVAARSVCNGASQRRAAYLWQQMRHNKRRRQLETFRPQIFAEAKQSKGRKDFSFPFSLSAPIYHTLCLSLSSLPTYMYLFSPSLVSLPNCRCPSVSAVSCVITSASLVQFLWVCLPMCVCLCVCQCVLVYVCVCAVCVCLCLCVLVFVRL